MGDVGVSVDEGWSGRSVLVTGAAGLLGGWVCRKLVGAGARVTGVDIDWPRGVLLGSDDAVERIDGDVRNRELMDSVLVDRGIDTVLHLAAQAFVGRANHNPTDTFEHNILGTWTVLESCRHTSEVRSIVVASSDKAYGDHGGDPYEESMPLLARHPYAASKTCADVLAQTYAESFGMPIAVTRCANMYGGGDTEWSRIIPGTIRSVLRAEPPVIRSDGHFVRSYLYVEDSAEGVTTLARVLPHRPELAGQAFNFAAETELSVLGLVACILELTGSDLEPEIRNDAVNEIREQRVIASKARKILGWTPAHTLDQGLTLTVEWYRTFLGAAA
ncbi:MAG: NAD-dependent epimerase/dehydratase family protein [Acidimicrobiales bacterium]